MTELEEFRHAKDEYFGTDPQSPLTPAQRKHFGGLKYFPENRGLSLEVLTEPSHDEDPVVVQTSTGDVQTYSRVGRFRFDVAGLTAELTIFESSSGLFLPFVDSLAGTETYPAGRYLDPKRISDGRYLVDFNYAYNPYCAYNAQWSCPLTPFENRLKVPVRAGEKLFEPPH